MLQTDPLKLLVYLTIETKKKFWFGLVWNWICFGSIWFDFLGFWFEPNRTKDSFFLNQLIHFRVSVYQMTSLQFTSLPFWISSSSSFSLPVHRLHFARLRPPISLPPTLSRLTPCCFLALALPLMVYQSLLPSRWAANLPKHHPFNPIVSSLLHRPFHFPLPS